MYVLVYDRKNYYLQEYAPKKHETISLASPNDKFVLKRRCDLHCIQHNAPLG